MSDTTPKALAKNLIGTGRTPTEDEQRLIYNTNFALTFGTLCFQCNSCGGWFDTDDQVIDDDDVDFCVDCAIVATLRCTD